MATACFIAGTVRSLQQNRRNLFLHLLSSKPLVSLGGFSYSLYLVHYPLVATIFFAFVSWCGRVAGWFWLLLGGVPLIVGIAYLFHYVFERPFLPTHLRMPKRATKPLDQHLTGVKSEPE